MGGGTSALANWRFTLNLRLAAKEHQRARPRTRRSAASRCWTRGTADRALLAIFPCNADLLWLQMKPLKMFRLAEASDRCRMEESMSVSKRPVPAFNALGRNP